MSRVPAAANPFRVATAREALFSGSVRTSNLAKPKVSNASFIARATAREATPLLRWRGSGTLIVVTHQVNITALTGVIPASGEGVVLRAQAGQLQVVGRLMP